MDKLYIALVSDSQTKDTIVLGVKAETATQGRHLVEKFYQAQDWGKPEYIRMETFRSNAKEDILFVGHAHAEYYSLEGQVRHLCEKLLEAAHLIESESPDASKYDEIRDFIAQFEIGQQVLDSE